MIEDSVNPPVPYVDGRHMGPDARLVTRANAGAAKIKEMGHSGMVSLESFLLMQGRTQRAFQKRLNVLTAEVRQRDATIARMGRQLDKAHNYITDLKEDIQALRTLDRGDNPEDE